MSEIFALQDIARLPAPNDNAAIATRRLKRRTRVRLDETECELDADVLEGHRFAVRAIAQEEALLSWGFRFGIATRALEAGNYLVNVSVLNALRERNVALDLPDEPNFRNQIEPYHFDEQAFLPGRQVAPYPVSRTFLGYRRSHGRGVGTRNVIVIVGLTSRAASYARALTMRCQKWMGTEPGSVSTQHFENIDGIAAVAHTEGSGADPLNNFELLLRTLAGMLIHPNVGAVLAVAHPDDAVNEKVMRAYLEQNNYPIHALPHAWLTLGANWEEDLARGENVVRAWLDEVNETARTRESLAHLKIALQCGGSDAFSGISGNPLVGAAAREIIRLGGSANLAETDELVGAEEYILKNVRDAATAQKFLNAISVFKTRLAWHGVTAEGNPSGGNMYRGLYNIVLKSLGAATKKDAAVRLDYVIQYAERMTDAGFYFMDSPGNDLEGIAGQMAAGCNLIFFTTGNGSITNFPFVPTIKVVTTTERYNLLANEMDVNAGTYLDGVALDKLTAQMLDLTTRVASGEKTRGERAQHSQVSIWRNWRQTDARAVNTFLAMPEPNGEPIPLREKNEPLRPLAFPIYDDGARIAHEFVGLILPTSLCASQVARLTAEQFNQKQLGQPAHLARFVTLTHTEGCGVSGDAYFAMYKRLMLNYMRHPLVRWGLFLEHGCEITHNDSMRARLREMGVNVEQFGWASIQLDGGVEKVQQKMAEWFAAHFENAKRLHRELVTIESARIGLMLDTTAPSQVIDALASFARNLVRQSGTLVMPSTAPLLRTKTFADDLLNAQFRNATLGYGQFAARRGFHIMDAPSQHWVETLSGLGATGVEIILAYGEKFPSQAHPFIPTLQFTCAENSDDAAAQNFDVVLRGDARTCVEQLEESMLKMLAGKQKPRTVQEGNSDFQITRGAWGVTV